jgi:hypothetical protein
MIQQLVFAVISTLSPVGVIQIGWYSTTNINASQPHLLLALQAQHALSTLRLVELAAVEVRLSKPAW